MTFNFAFVLLVCLLAFVYHLFKFPDAVLEIAMQVLKVLFRVNLVCLLNSVEVFVYLKHLTLPLSYESLLDGSDD